MYSMSPHSDCNNNVSPAASWYVVYCKPRQELITKTNLKWQGFDVFLPMIKSKKYRRGKWVEVVEVMFSRYLFVRLNLTAQSTAPIRSTKGAIDLVRFSGRPAFIPNEVIGGLLEYENKYLNEQNADYPHINEGEDVRVVEGPLAGMDCVFSRCNGEQRVVVLLEMLGKINEIIINRDWIAQVA